MDNILSAREWIEEINKKEGSEYSVFDCNPILMERYANYKTRKLDVKILGFRQMLQNVDTSTGGTVIVSPDKDSLDGFEITNYYDKYFNIVKDR